MIGPQLSPSQNNILSTPMRSPFRYPGGKTWLIPRIRQWLHSLPYRPTEFIEPFAGGGIVGLTVVFEQLADHVTLVELDNEVGAVWQTILNGGGEWLAHKIITFELTPESVEAELSKTNLTLKEKAFQTILKNRVNRGGILTSGAGKIKSGENKRGLKSRWYSETLRKRILAIATIQNNITFIQGDGVEILERFIQCKNVAFFVDPPYTLGEKKAGSRLYTHSELDHEELFRIVSKLTGDFLMTYNDDEVVRELAQFHGFATKKITMKNTHHKKMTELLIGRNLNWVID